MSLIRIGLALLLLVATTAQMVYPVQGRRKLCGEALSDALDLICTNGFASRAKRSTAVQDRGLALIRKLQPHRPEMDMDMETETGTDRPATGSLRKLRRLRRRVAHACCKEGCTYDDIMDYCA
ncbi:probable insulin-like peptide 4 [Drosophila serrata]|uniref:probable insulin-like peptide 4 n=1 Tax=Drosophila serrata TaxID=7274 RepID=UPI000A1D3719|nr:probable insulin-like peptide 4 [Drosophila serrata]